MIRQSDSRVDPVIEILVVGNEILSGRTVDTNSAAIRDMLTGAGYRVAFIGVVGDSRAGIARSLHHAAARSDIVIVTGGLGPTSDDMTMDAVRDAFSVDLVEDSRVIGWIEARFRRFGRPMSDSNRKQALIPRGAEAIENPAGTAPGVRLVLTADMPSGGGAPELYFLPGVPVEARMLFETEVLPRIAARFPPPERDTAVVKVAGISESALYDRLRSLPGAEEMLSYYPGYDGIEVGIDAGADAPVTAAGMRDAIVALLGDHVYATDRRGIEKVVADLLTDRRRTVAVAESCTGGLIADRLTDVPGSSEYFLQGVVAYANEAKTGTLGVDSALIREHGAVSEPVAAAMAEGVRRLAGADIGLSTTGIAGPGGGSPEKPVGLMFAGIATADGVETKRLQFPGDRRINKQRMSAAVLGMLRLHLIQATKQGF